MREEASTTPDVVIGQELFPPQSIPKVKLAYLGLTPERAVVNAESNTQFRKGPVYEGGGPCLEE